jgi:hypothetical protein
MVSSICRQWDPIGAGLSERGPVAASLHNPVRPQEGLKNAPEGNFLPRIRSAALPVVNNSD